ncbi:MAG: DUF4974 domain-containing protein [Dysgonamonadaceae bacterium]|jgi:ferric-dicitrate binding protein FerR (iron transport regulator)|nr:DUF4974 domain-containing protein [Dysgonamonadaceae bacterium]
MNSRIWELIDKYINQKITKDEREELKRWMNESNDHKNFLITVLSLYKKHRQLSFLEEFNPDSAWDNLNRKIKTRRRVRKLIAYSSAAAASILLLLGISFYLFTGAKQVSLAEMYPNQGKIQAVLALSDGTKIDLQGENSQSEYNEKDGTTIVTDTTGLLSYQSLNSAKIDYSLVNTIVVPRGGEYSLVLSDGTKVYLNAGSELEFPVHFSSKRIVKLTGEAYFEVKKDTHKPFIVEIANHAIEVLGTSFNVSAYPEADCYTTLVAGTVKLQTSSDTRILSPNQQAVINKTSDGISVRNVNASIYTSWIKGTFEFQNTPLSTIVEQLSRWYDVDMQFQSEELKHIRFTGAILRKKPLAFAISAIEKISDVEFKKTDGIVIIKSLE